MLRMAIADFMAQTHRERELVIVHDASQEFDHALQALVAGIVRNASSGRSPSTGAAALAPSIRVHREEAGASLGTLRNRAVALAEGAYICQWDDDDRYHPERLTRQYDALVAEQADACCLVDQWHWFQTRGEIYWDDWSVETYPFNVIPGTLLCRRAHMPSYPDSATGEDSAAMSALIRAGLRIARLRDSGWTYIYVHHGGNVFAEAHHAAISHWKALRGARLVARSAQIERRFAEYAELPSLRWPNGVDDLRLAK